MPNLAEIWNHAKPNVKLMFWLTLALYVGTLVLAFIILGYSMGYGVVWDMVKPNLLRVIQFLALWPVLPMLILVLIDGNHHRKLTLNNPENIEA